MRIEGETGELLLETSSNGPLLYAALDPGTYTVEVSGRGRHYTQVAEIAEARGTRERLTFIWPVEETAHEPEPTPAER